MRSVLFYLLGVPIPIIILIALFTHHAEADRTVRWPVAREVSH